jgi:hypothetical protein
VPQIAGTIRADGIYQPELIVEVQVGPSKSFPLKAIVDSGADRTLFRAEEIVGHGIKYDDLEELSLVGRGVGVDRTFACRRLHSSISWRGQVFARSVIVAEPGSFETGSLGRQDFFKTFGVSFEGWRDETPWMDISSYPPGLHLV